jgi:hypothetical protein
MIWLLSRQQVPECRLSSLLTGEGRKGGGRSLILRRRKAFLSITHSILSGSSFLRVQLEFLKSLWGLGTEEEEGYRTGPPGYIGWRNSFLGIDSGAPYTFKNTGEQFIIPCFERTSFYPLCSFRTGHLRNCD